MNKVTAIIWKDIITELRTKEMFTSMFIFALVILVIFNFAFGFSADITPQASSAILWVAFSFAGMLGLGRSFALEMEGNAMLGLLLTPVDRSLIYLGKMIGNVLFMFIVEIIVLPLFVLFFNINVFEHAPSLLLTLALGTVGFVSVGTLFSAMAANTRLREVLLPLLLFPIVIPVIASSVKLTEAVLSGGGLTEASGSLKVLVAFDIIFVTTSAIVFEYIVED
ncbi:MAG: heme exporter protein CcmB [Candidatus Dadabacteria bacterium]|nr:heme exporter protein CcmB [Candidatus Dadabacteria bacterium]